jgi:tRNA (uracil-5-)-methyltransferase TRM9
VSPEHGRVLIYVWAVEQDGLSKRSIPESHIEKEEGQDVFVPWVSKTETEQVFHRYYHMFDRGELARLVEAAAKNMGLAIGPMAARGSGVEMVQVGWERSNYYVELRRWKAKHLD